jgi:C-terminal processing protease CtpA/Prc
MRVTLCCALVVLAVACVGARADDAPQGLIGLKLKVEDGKVVVVEPLKDSPADKAGFKPDDVILKVDNFKVKDNAEQEDLMATIKEIVTHKPGDKIKLTIKRADKEMTIEVTVGKRSEIIKDNE